MRMKPVPKAIIVVALVGGIGYGASVYLEHRKANPPAVVEAPAPAAVAPAPAPVEAAPAPAPATPPPRATAQQPQDRGLSNLLGK